MLGEDPVGVGVGPPSGAQRVDDAIDLADRAGHRGGQPVGGRALKRELGVADGGVATLGGVAAQALADLGLAPGQHGPALLDGRRPNLEIPAQGGHRRDPLGHALPRRPLGEGPVGLRRLVTLQARQHLLQLDDAAPLPFETDSRLPALVGTCSGVALRLLRLHLGAPHGFERRPPP